MNSNSKLPIPLAELVYDHPDFIVINKPAGIAVQDEAESTGILRNLLHIVPDEKLWLVHRLDKVTSGLLILAKSAESAATLSELFATRNIQKWYVALLSKKPKKKQGTISGDMRKVRDGKWILLNAQTNPAITQFFSFGFEDGIRMALLKPISGKTHQLRAAMKSQSAPILGDSLYGGTESDRTYLHAWAMQFEYAGQQFRFTAKPTSGERFNNASLESVAEQINTPWELAWPTVPAHLLRAIGATERD